MDDFGKLPDIATLFANYLREATGDQRLYARVIGPHDPANTDSDGEAYISVGRLFMQCEETTLMLVYPPPARSALGVAGWSLHKVVDYLATRSEPEFTDFETVYDDTLNVPLTTIFSKMAELLFWDRVNGLSQSLYHDINVTIDRDVEASLARLGINPPDETEETEEQSMFRNFYRCYSCQHEWEDVWPAQPDDDCPKCGARHVSPYKSEDA